ncbi:hypothetical protein EU408_06435 [Salmonella enterica subsp. enterica]|nr:hypothetical protein [Salmonella enterica subsp. enterica serovar Corvallis]EAB6416727.1 hypothetical protein [Salmonella enterica subsp. enterica]EBS6354459.1 hypothetical protein [Salmonella enterica subsp. enterica serovar Albany]EBV1906488.1 hypothetical protein [Salmonella enterica subsp. enterica serovar Kande]EBW4800605.1 hypothetical protein [Salmonella enterica subsp. enterica serovar Corvallis]
MKFPYAFRILPALAADSNSYLRTIQSFNLPGGKKRNLTLKEGDSIEFSALLAVLDFIYVNNRRKQKIYYPKI